MLYTNFYLSSLVGFISCKGGEHVLMRYMSSCQRGSSRIRGRETCVSEACKGSNTRCSIASTRADQLLIGDRDQSGMQGEQYEMLNRKYKG